MVNAESRILDAKIYQWSWRMAVQQFPWMLVCNLFQEVEAHQRQRYQARAILAGEDRGQSARHQQLQELKGLFPGVPLHLLQRVPGAGTWDASKLPFNRRRRRQLESAKHLVIYAFSGPNEAEWKRYETDQVTVLCLDSLVGVNLLDDNVAAWLEHLLQSRDVDLWLSSPPCKNCFSVSATWRRTTTIEKWWSNREVWISRP